MTHYLEWAELEDRARYSFVAYLANERAGFIGPSDCGWIVPGTYWSKP